MIWFMFIGYFLFYWFDYFFKLGNYCFMIENYLVDFSLLFDVNFDDFS